MRRPVVGALLLLAATARAQAVAPRFADIPWHSDVATTKSRMESRGYTFTKVDSNGDAWFTGTTLGTRATIIMLFNQHRQLGQAQITVLTSEDECRSTYDSLRDLLRAKYGEATESVEHYYHPDLYDPRDEQAANEIIKAGSSNIATIWGKEATGGLVLAITQRMYVKLTYQAATWPLEIARRQKNRTADF